MDSIVVSGPLAFHSKPRLAYVSPQKLGYIK